LQNFFVGWLKEDSREKHGGWLNLEGEADMKRLRRKVIVSYLELVGNLIAIDSKAEKSSGGVAMATNEQARGHPLSSVFLVTVSALKITSRDDIAVLAADTAKQHV
jgi:hypothetical protein